MSALETYAVASSHLCGGYLGVFWASAALECCCNNVLAWHLEQNVCEETRRILIRNLLDTISVNITLFRDEDRKDNAPIRSRGRVSYLVFLLNMYHGHNRINTLFNLPVLVYLEFSS